MNIKQFFDLKPLTTFKLGPKARYFIEIKSEDDLKEAVFFSQDAQLPIVVLSGGSNTIFKDEDTLDAVVVWMKIEGFEVKLTGGEKARVLIGAGEKWDQAVAKSVEAGLSGIEAMSGIPGYCGATPVQNVGAYGQEIKDVLTRVKAYDLKLKEFRTFTNEECKFGYRESIFKKSNRYIITQIELELSTAPAKIPNYPGVLAYFEEKNITQPTLEEIREAIITIRNSKLPNPSELPSVGSFFKNPFIAAEKAKKLNEEYEKIPLFEQADGNYKIGAGWLIDQVGLKGQTLGNIGIYKENALILTNNGEATYSELDSAVKKIQNQVESKFEIKLEPEPNFI